MLELDCVHEVPGSGAWLKIPLGKLLTERMVPIDEETVELIDRIAATARRAGRCATRAPASWPTSCSPTRAAASRQTLCARSCTAPPPKPGLDGVVPHQLRHTYATALVNAGCSLQALMALLGHVSAEMSLRYGRLFDATVRDEYQRALTLAKAQLGPVLPGERTQLPLAAITGGNWRDAPLIKARLAGGYCLRTAAQGSCAYANICEHCPNFRSEASFLPVLQLQRADAEALAADAAARGWGEEAARHRRLIERLDLLINQAHARLTATSWPGSRPPAPSSPPPGSPSRSGTVAARARISRTTLYRRADLRAVVEEHRARGQDATTLTGLAVQIDQLRRSLEAVAAKVRRHEETIRRLERARRKPG